MKRRERGAYPTLLGRSLWEAWFDAQNRSLTEIAQRGGFSVSTLKRIRSGAPTDFIERFFALAKITPEAGVHFRAARLAAPECRESRRRAVRGAPAR